MAALGILPARHVYLPFHARGAAWLHGYRARSDRRLDGEAEYLASPPLATLLPSVATFAWFYPLYTAIPLSPEQVGLRMWLESWR